VKASDDRRVTELHLSAAGRRLVDKVTRTRVQDLSEIVARMPPETWGPLIEALGQFSSAAGEPAQRGRCAWQAPVERGGPARAPRSRPRCRAHAGPPWSRSAGAPSRCC